MIARSYSEDDQQSPVENDVIQPTSSSEPIATTEDSLPLEETIQDVKSSIGPSELLSSEDNNISGPSDPVVEDVTESITIVDESNQDAAKADEVSSEAPAPAVTSPDTPMDLLLYPAVRVPTAPLDSNPTTVAAASLPTLPLELVAPPLAFVEKTTSKKVEINTELPFYSPVKLPKATVNNTAAGVMKKINKTSTAQPQVSYKAPQHRPITSYNPPDSINPYLGEEQDKPIYLPPTFTGPNALPINLYSSSEEDNFPISRPFGPSKPKKLDFPPISNTDENFGYQVDWW